MFKNKSSKAVKAANKQQPPVFKQHYFNNCHKTYSCIHCRAHLANHDELISKLFQGNHGRAYLFNKVVNIGCKQAVQRELLTGLHAVADIYCDNCETTLGWKYQQAFVPSQKYKEGKYIIELVHMLKENDWDLTSYNARQLLAENSVSSTSSNVAAENARRFRGMESRRIGNFLGDFNEFNSFNLEDKSNGAIRMVSLEYELGTGVTNDAIDEAQRGGHQESSVDIVRQPKQNPPPPLSPPSVTFDIRLVDSENNDQDLQNGERRPQEETDGGNPEFDVMDSSTKGLQHLALYKCHPSDAQDLPVSLRDSLSSSRSQSHFSSSANSIVDGQVTDEEVVDDLAQLSNRKHDNFKVTNNENLPEECSDKSNSGNKLMKSEGFDLLLSSVGSSTSAV